MKTRRCWACRLANGDVSEHKTRWYYVGPEGAVVVDLHARGHALRLLYVPCKHVPCGQETAADRAVAKRLLLAVGYAVCVESGMRLKMAGLELGKHSFKEHWHAQLCLDAE